MRNGTNMANVLISFMGKVRREQGGQYRETRYRFEDGLVVATRFFGLELARHTRPDRLVVLGTSGSMWDVFLEQVGYAFPDHLEQVQDAVDEDGVTSAMLVPLAEALGRQLECECYLEVIPYGLDDADQVQILSILERHVTEHDELRLDVTHGLRHLPMLGLLGALWLKSLRGVETTAIHYGAYERRESMDGVEVTPVIRLDGLLRMAAWIQSLSSYRKDGDYGVFAARYQDFLPESANRLQKAAFFERNINISAASQELNTFLRELRHAERGVQDPLHRHFDPVLRERIRWAQDGSPLERGTRLAWEHWERRDYLRATIHALESLVTQRLRNEREDEQDFQNREDALNELREDNEDVALLAGLRNALAHGLRPGGRRQVRDQVKRLLQDEQVLHAQLERLFRRLLRS